MIGQQVQNLLGSSTVGGENVFVSTFTCLYSITIGLRGNSLKHK